MTSAKRDVSACGRITDTWSWCADRDSPALKSSFLLSGTLYEEGMASAARFCSHQAAHFANLSECRNPWDLMAYQTEFVEKWTAFGLDEFRRMMDRNVSSFREDGDQRAASCGRVFEKA